MENSATTTGNWFIFAAAVVVLALLASFLTCYYSTPTVFGGRDQGAIATAAINLAKNKSLTFSTPISQDLFEKYGPGKALNFPGFDYTAGGQLITRFPKAYIIYLAGFYTLFGLKGIQFANLAPLFLFFILFWLTLRHFFSEKISFLGFLITVTFFPFLWFAKYTLTEIFMLFLVWAGVYFLIKGSTLRSKKVEPYLYLSLAFFALSALTRIEGIVFFLLAVGYIYILNRKKIIALPKNFQKYLLIFVMLLLILYFFLNFHDLLDSAKNIAKAFLPDSTKDSAPSVGLYTHLTILFFKYNILAYLILGLAGIFLLIKKLRQSWTKPEFLIIFILFPSFFYLLFPLISLDDPWLFRRFAFSVFPALIFYSIYFLNRYKKNNLLVYAIFFVFIISNLTITGRYISYSENKNLLPQVESLSKKFGASDLILVDRLASGSGWSLISEPLNTIYAKQAVYFFNAEDLKYIKKNNYENIYLIAPPARNAVSTADWRSDAGRLDGKQAWYDNLNKELVSTIPISNNYLKESSGFFSLSQNIEMITTNGIWRIR